MNCNAIFCLLLTCFIRFVQSKTSFVKDLSTDFPFPVTNVYTVAGVPVGHLRPLGYQKKPDGKVREEKDPVNTATFHMLYIKNSRPVVFRGAIARTPVLEKWEEDAYLKEHFGKLNVSMTVKKQEKKPSKRRMLLRKFLLDYKYEDWYLASTVNADMLPELPLPDLLKCGSYRERMTEAELWMSSGGTSSLLHSHADHNLHCVVDGRKDFIVIEPKHKAVFRYEETYPNSGEGSSPMDMDMLNAFKNPKISKTPWIWSTLWQGDCIFIPAGHLHQVRAYGRSISYTLQFAPIKDFDSTDCKEEGRSRRKKKDKKVKDKAEEDATEVKDKLTTLAEVKFIWGYSQGNRHLSEKRLAPESLRHILLLLVRDGDQLHQAHFEHFYEEALHKDTERPPADEIFHAMTPSEDRDYISRDEITSLKSSKLESICEVFNKQFKMKHEEL